MRLAAGFRLGDWVVRPADGSVTSGGTTKRLEPLLMDLLVFLCSRPRQVVSKDDVLAHVWQGRFVSEDTLKASFYHLRKTLGDSVQSPRYIETLPKRGYRLLVDPVSLDPETRDPPSAAQDLYRKGTSLLAEQPSAADLTQARVYFERALELDPDHHAAAAALALVYVHLVAAGDGDLMSRARSLSGRAAAGPPSAARALALGVTTLLHDRDAVAAEQNLREAIALDPRDANAHRWYAKLLSFCGRHDEAISEARNAVSADPLSIATHRDLLEALFMARRYDEAIEAARGLLGVAGHAPEIQLGLAWIHWILGDEQRAFDAVYAGFGASGVSRDVLDRVARAFATRGMREVFRLWVQVLEQQAALGQETIDLLVLYALLGESDRAFGQLDRLLRLCHPALLWVPVSPLLDGLRSDVRYSGILARLRPGIPS